MAVTIRVPEEIYSAVLDLCDDYQRTPNAIIVQCLRDGLGNYREFRNPISAPPARSTFDSNPTQEIKADFVELEERGTLSREVLEGLIPASPKREITQ